MNKENGFWKIFPWQKIDVQADGCRFRDKKHFLRILRLKPGTVVPLHAHKWPHDVIVLSGKLIVNYQGRVKTYKAGQVYRITKSGKHGGKVGKKGCIQMEIFKKA